MHAEGTSLLAKSAQSVANLLSHSHNLIIVTLVLLCEICSSAMSWRGGSWWKPAEIVSLTWHKKKMRESMSCFYIPCFYVPCRGSWHGIFVAPGSADIPVASCSISLALAMTLHKRKLGNHSAGFWVRPPHVTRGTGFFFGESWMAYYLTLSDILQQQWFSPRGTQYCVSFVERVSISLAVFTLCYSSSKISSILVIMIDSRVSLPLHWAVTKVWHRLFEVTQATLKESFSFTATLPKLPEVDEIRSHSNGLMWLLAQ